MHSTLPWHLSSPYQSYTYAYPHKEAYRPFAQPLPLAPLWAGEDKQALFAYLHLPFCSMRCGFCNLFAMAQPDEALVEAYLDQLLVQMQVMAEVLGGPRHAQFARFAFGGGTPSYLSAHQLARVFEALTQHWGLDLRRIPAGIEMSPETVSADRLALCHAAGIDRVSLGIQSFAAHETRHLARPQQPAQVRQAIEAIQHQGFATLNLDLIYGIEGQTVASFLASIDSALAFAPQELYLYPLYVRPSTGLGRLQLHPQDLRAELYRAGREHLRAAGYTQVSMRMFRAPHAPADTGPHYCCQNDGMVGLGTGARSYTRSVHYASPYAVQRSATRELIQQWLRLTPEALSHAHHGFVLDREEQQRRYLIQSLLAEPGLAEAAYTQRFGSAVLDDWPGLQVLLTEGLATRDNATGDWRLTDRGYAYADSIGPWLISPVVRGLVARSPAALGEHGQLLAKGRG